jgi:hypothetical protein
MEENRRRSQRITDAEILKAAAVEENRLIVSGGRLLKKSPSRELLPFGIISTRRLHSRHGRLYIKTEEGYYIFDHGTHWGSQEQAQEEDPEPEAKAITLYYYLGKLFRRTKDGVLAEDENILQEILG